MAFMTTSAFKRVSKIVASRCAVEIKELLLTSTLLVYALMNLQPKLHQSLHNQLYARVRLDPRASNKNENIQELSLRNTRFTSGLADIITYCKSRLEHILLLDVSYAILDSCAIQTLCINFFQLQALHAKSCGLAESLDAVEWPHSLQALDLSRNRLKSCPNGVFKLIHLHSINLSGNCIASVPKQLLELPNLKKCYFLSNPICNIPKAVCREGVRRMRSFFSIKILELAQCTFCNAHNTGSKKFTSSSNKICIEMKKPMLRSHLSFESDYGSSLGSHSTASSSSSSDTDFSDGESCSSSKSKENLGLPVTILSHLPKGYRKKQESTFCQVYLPENCSQVIEVSVVKDHSIHPKLQENELLATPVIRIAPHGLKFEQKPAVIILPHCSKRIETDIAKFVPICSNTAEFQSPFWRRLDPCFQCVVDKNHVLFSTSHFSLFSVILVLSYPSSSLTVRPNVGGTLLVPELPGFQLHIPNRSVHHLSKPVTVTSTVHFCDKTYNASDAQAPASACIKLEPHGLQFGFPVEVSVPLPDYAAISRHFPDVRIGLWMSERPADCRDTPMNWQLLNNADVLLEDFDNKNKLARFEIHHFSWYELLYQLCASSLQTLGLGASFVYNRLPSRMRYIFVRYQVFISSLYELTFGLLVTIYKFGDPLTGLSNYPVLVADSGTKRIPLHIGELHLRLAGHFTANQELEESLERGRRIIDFTGEDFCERFEFALQLKPTLSVPLQPGQLLGQIHFTQQSRSISCNLIMPHPTTPLIHQSPHIKHLPVFDEFTPPRTPEPQNSCYTQCNGNYSGGSVGKRKRNSCQPAHSPCTSRAKRKMMLSDDSITDKDLLSISRQCSSKYLELGVHLGLDYQTVMNRISRQEGKGEHLKALEVLQEWKGRGFSFSDLVQALEEVGLHQVAAKYCYQEVPGPDQ